MGRMKIAFAYSINYPIDTAAAIIVDVAATPGSLECRGCRDQDDACAIAKAVYDVVAQGAGTAEISLGGRSSCDFLLDCPRSGGARTTQRYDRRREELSLDEVERIKV